MRFYPLWRTITGKKQIKTTMKAVCFVWLRKLTENGPSTFSSALDGLPEHAKNGNMANAAHSTPSRNFFVYLIVFLAFYVLSKSNVFFQKSVFYKYNFIIFNFYFHNSPFLTNVTFRTT